MKRSRQELVAGAIVHLVHQGADLTDAAISKEAKLGGPVVTELLDTKLGAVWGKLPIGWKIGRADGAVIVYRP